MLERYRAPKWLATRGVELLGRLLAWGRSNVVEVTVVGVAEVEWGFGFRLGEILLPAGIVRDLDLLPVSDPMELLALSSGTVGSAWPMIMSILERTREIGILGSVGGVLLGLGVSRIASMIARTWMAREGMPDMDMFFVPLWVLPAAIAFGTSCPRPPA